MRLAILIAAVALSACGQREDAKAYPPGYEIQFMQGCESQSDSRALCACIWDKIEAEVPAADFAALDRMPGPQREAHPLMTQINNYSFACAAQLPAEPPATP